MKTKYPRTYHVEWSEGRGSDDKIQYDLSYFHGKEIVITEKMDGENTTMMNDCYYARSLDSNNHPSRNYVKGIWGRIKHDIPENFRICGENLYAQHSLIYNDLPDYFEDLKNSLASAKSIKDLQKEAFYAARKDKFEDVPFEHNEYLYETFKDYLKFLEI